MAAAQVESAVGFTSSTLLVHEIALRDRYVQQRNFDNYIPAHMPNMRQVQVHNVSSTNTSAGLVTLDYLRWPRLQAMPSLRDN